MAEECSTCHGMGIVSEEHDGGYHPVHCPKGCPDPVERARKAEAKVQRVRNVLYDEWGMASIDGTPFDEDFADAIHEDGAWRLARDLRVALADAEEDPDA